MSMVNEQVVGMMNEAYAQSRSELIQWINSFFNLSIKKVEECATGAIHCQILDAIYPKKIKMSKVNFGAKYDHEFMKNFKVLQDAFSKLGVKKVVPVEKLIKAKYQDNLEFLQWMYQFFQSNYNGEDYDPTSRRSKSKGVGSLSKKRAASKENQPRSEQQSRPPKATAYRKPMSRKTSRSSNADAKKLAECMKKVEEYERNMKIVLQERDFYFQKIVEIEKLCLAEDFKGSPLSEAVCKIMYDDGAEEGKQEA